MINCCITKIIFVKEDDGKNSEIPTPACIVVLNNKKSRKLCFFFILLFFSIYELSCAHLKSSAYVKYKKANINIQTI